MKPSKLYAPICFALVTALTLSCAEKKEDTEAVDESATGGGVAGGGGGGDGSSNEKLAAATDVSDLKLTNAFKINLPGAFAEKSAGAGLRLTEAKKSQEACQMGQTVKDSVRSLESIGNFFCHLEIEKDKMTFGKKFLINSNGVEFARIFVDNSEAATGKISIGFCSKQGDDESNRELITIEGLSDVGPRGSVYNSGENSHEGVAQTYGSATTFDMTTEGLVNVISSQLHESDGNTFRRKVELALVEAGVSNAKLASKGMKDGHSFAERGAAMFDGTLGSAIYQNAGSYNGQAFSFARRAYFDEPGNVLTAADVTEAVIPQLTDMPAFLDENFSTSIPAGWVADGCQDYEDVIDLNPESAEHQACGGGDQEHRECIDDTKFDTATEDVELD
jgi:hypothetical protein